MTIIWLGLAMGLTNSVRDRLIASHMAVLPQVSCMVARGGNVRKEQTAHSTLFCDQNYRSFYTPIYTIANSKLRYMAMRSEGAVQRYVDELCSQEYKNSTRLNNKLIAKPTINVVHMHVGGWWILIPSNDREDDERKNDQERREKATGRYCVAPLFGMKRTRGTTRLPRGETNNDFTKITERRFTEINRFCYLCSKTANEKFVLI
uniref:Uncharacterized protein n=1 Tax=Romanomermis culicivorax TaxID=13658 RepID=A0A915JPK0_ROMCU